MKLEVGMYVRYIPTLGEYTQLISKITKKESRLLDVAYYLDNEDYPVFSSHFDDILKTSCNIIDLIKVGDYVNGQEVTQIDVRAPITKNKAIECTYETGGSVIAYTYDNKDIKFIVTKEQFESMKYEVK